MVSQMERNAAADVVDELVDCSKGFSIIERGTTSSWWVENGSAFQNYL